VSQKFWTLQLGPREAKGWRMEMMQDCFGGTPKEWSLAELC